MSEPIVSKRLHISGLTSAISADDLTRRLGTFGKVTALDGLGVLNAVGLPRPFGYATLETTPSKLTRCLTLLSGTTWKGAKLRIGEAKPDYDKRIALEKERPEPPPKRRRFARGIQGVHASDMSLVTPETAVGRGNWHVFPSGRTVRTIRTRPVHPLPPKTDTLVTSMKQKSAKSSKRKVGNPVPPSRARRRTIDMTKWGSTHLKGIYLDSGLKGTTVASSFSEVLDFQESETEAEDVEEEGANHSISSLRDSGLADFDATMPLVTITADHTATTTSVGAPVELVDPAPPSRANMTEEASLAAEKSQTLDFLNSLFGDQEEWGERESVEEHVIASSSAHIPAIVDANSFEDIEEVPRVTSSTNESISAVNGQQPSPSVPRATPNSSAVGQPTKLKDLFAPREEEGGFSLFGNLELELELEDNPFALPSVPEPSSTHIVPTTVIEAPIPAGRVTLDPQTTLFFPFSASRCGKRKSDPLIAAVERGRHWRDCFFRTENEEAIRERWDKTKLELTREWKKRHREAVKSQRRRGMGDYHD